MKILHVIDSGGLYGAEVMLLSLMEVQVNMGLEPILASIGERSSASKPLEIEACRRGLTVQCFRMTPGPNLIGAFEILRYAWRQGVDLLHSHGYKGNILLGFLPRFVRRMPMIATVHGWTWTGGASRMMVYEWLDSLSFSRIDRVVLVNELMKGHPRLKNRPRLRVEVVANGVPDNSLSDRNDGGDSNPEIVEFCRQGGITIGAIGRLSPEKGLDLLLDVVATLVADGHDVRLLLLGEGGLRGFLEEKAGKLGLEGRFFMPGYVEKGRIYLQYLQLFAMPSLTEGLPIVLLEAMQAGVPIVASRVGGIPNLLDNGRAGLLIEPASAEDLKRGILETMSDPTATEWRVQSARERVSTKFSSQTMVETYLGIYQTVIGR